MDWPLILSAGAALASFVAAAVAISQAATAARQARFSQAASEEAGRRAQEANDALARYAAAQESIALAQRPNAWGAPTPVSGTQWAIRNSSGREMVVHAVEVTPNNAQRFLRIEQSLPLQLRAGGFLRFDVDRRMGIAVDVFTIVWAFADDPQGRRHRSERLLGH